MKKILTIIAVALLAGVTNLCAQVKITKVDKVQPTQEIFMDMAMTAATKAKADGQPPCGTVIILNNAWKATGTPTASSTCEENAIAKSHLGRLTNATVYTLVEPTAAAFVALSVAAPDAVYFVIPRETAIAKGIYPASAYGEVTLPEGVQPVTLIQMPFADAQKLIK